VAPEELCIPSADLAAVQQEVRSALGIPDANPVVIPIQFFEPQSGQWLRLNEAQQLPLRKDVPVKLRCGARCSVRSGACSINVPVPRLAPRAAPCFQARVRLPALSNNVTHACVSAQYVLRSAIQVNGV
jgi:hypothetical protein